MIKIKKISKATRKKVLSLLDTLITKCGGPGGKPGPCPLGKQETTKGGEQLHKATRGEGGVWKLKDGTHAPEHIQKLGIPPAWKDVSVNLNPKGDLLARGKDAKGRTQPRYSDNHSMRAAADKFGRVSELIKKRDKIFKEVDEDVRKGNHPEEAACTKLVMKTGMRPGSDGDTHAEYKSYGATTLEGRHVIQKPDGSVVIRFVPGKKKGQEIEMQIHDVAFGKELLERAARVGPTGRMHNTDAGKVRDYSKSKDGGGFKTKDHRTALGTETASQAIANHPVPSNLKEYKAAVKEISTKVSDTLGNTPSIAFKSYINPNVWASWKAKIE